MIYDSEFNVIGRKSFSLEECHNPNSFDIFFNGNNYTIVIDNNKGNTLIKEITDIEIIKVEKKTDALQGDEEIIESKTNRPTFIETDMQLTEKNLVETEMVTEKKLIETEIPTEIKTEKNLIETDMQTEKKIVIETDIKSIETDMKTEKNMIETDIKTIKTDIKT